MTTHVPSLDQAKADILTRMAQAEVDRARAAADEAARNAQAADNHRRAQAADYARRTFASLADLYHRRDEAIAPLVEPLRALVDIERQLRAALLDPQLDTAIRTAGVGRSDLLAFMCEMRVQAGLAPDHRNFGYHPAEEAGAILAAMVAHLLAGGHVDLPSHTISVGATSIAFKL